MEAEEDGLKLRDAIIIAVTRNDLDAGHETGS